MRCELRRRWLRRPAFAVCAVGIAACGSSGPGGVAVDSLQTNILFGVGQPTPSASAAPGQGAAPSSAPLPASLGPIASTFPQQPGLAQPVTSGPAYPIGPPVPGSTCTTAPASAFPAQPATAEVTSPPATGAYKWVGSGTHDLTVMGITIPLPVAPSFQDVVRHVKPFQDNFPQPPGSATGLDFTFQTIQPQLGSTSGGYYQFVWQVKTNAAVADPEAGLSLIEVDTMDAKGAGLTPIFTAAQHNGLLLLPLPANPGPVEPPAAGGAQGVLPVSPPASSTQSVDTSGHGNTMQFSGTVGSPERVDACGTWLQAWPVDGTLVNGPSQATIHLDVATQMGAVLIAMNIDGGFLGATYHKAKTHTGQTPPPSPLPAQWQ